MRRLPFFTSVILAFLFSCKQVQPDANEISDSKIESVSILDKQFQFSTSNQSVAKKHIHTEQYFVDSTIMISNSYPKGGAYRSKGKSFGYGIFFSVISNNGLVPIKMNLGFSAGSIPFDNSSDSKVSVFLPSDTLTNEKFDLFDYGLKDLSFFENSTLQNKTTTKTIKPKEQALVYIAVLFDGFDNGPFRTSLELRGNDLHYNITNGGLLESMTIPCGEILF